MPTLTQLEYIVTVSQLKHFRRAAEACHVSQPSLSMQIQKVEDEIGMTLFDRNRKPIQPTEKGERYIKQAKVILEETKRLLALAKSDAACVGGNFRLGIIPTIAPYLTPLFLLEFSTAYPEVELKIDEMKTHTIVKELREGTLDAGILATPLHEIGIREQHLFYEEFFLFVGPKHALAHRKRIKEEELDRGEMWLLQDGHCLRTQMLSLCSKNLGKSVFKNIHFEGGSLETLRHIIKKNKGYTLVPRLFVETLPDHEKKELIKEFETPKPSRQVSLVYRQGHWKTDILNALEKVIIKNLPKSIVLDLDRQKNHVIGLSACRLI